MLQEKRILKRNISLLVIILFSLTNWRWSYVSSFVPPHPNFVSQKDVDDDDDDDHNEGGMTSFQSVHAYRQEKNISYDYNPSTIHPELCRNVNEQQCQLMDESFRRHTKNGRKLVESGELRVLVLLLQWNNHRHRHPVIIDDATNSNNDTNHLIDPADIDELWNSEKRIRDVVPTGSVASYVRINSYDSFHLKADIIPWLTTDHSESYYSNGVSGLPTPNTSTIREAIIPLLNIVDETGLDWTRYDADGDQLIDSLVVLHSGYNAELGGNECEVGPDVAHRIWSHSQGPLEGGSSDIGWTSKYHPVSLGGYMITSAFHGTCGNDIAKIGIILHELLHSLGLPYLYDLDDPFSQPANNNGGDGDGTGDDNSTVVAGVVGGAGSYDIMSNPYGQNDDASYPGHLSPWSKMKLGWLTCKEIEHDGTYIIGASEVLPEVYRLSKGYAAGEYLLIENRQPVLFDAGLWSPGGILIWHIDENVISYPFEGNTNRGFPDQSPQYDGELPWPENGRHYPIAVLQADGLYELERGINNGNSDDFWVGNHILTSSNNTNNDNENEPVYPNTDGYAFGTVVQNGVSIGPFSPAGNIMRFQVHGVAKIPSDGNNGNDDATTYTPAPAPTCRTWIPPTSRSSINVQERDVSVRYLNDEYSDCWDTVYAPPNSPPTSGITNEILTPVPDAGTIQPSMEAMENGVTSEPSTENAEGSAIMPPATLPTPNENPSLDPNGINEENSPSSSSSEEKNEDNGPSSKPSPTTSTTTSSGCYSCYYQSLTMPSFILSFVTISLSSFFNFYL